MEMRSVINRPKPIRPWRITHVELLHRSKPKHAILREGGKYILPDYAEKYTKPWAEIRWWDNTSSLCPSWFLNAHHQHFLPSPAQPQPAPHSTAWALPFHQYPQLCRSPPSSNSSRYMSPLKTPGADTLGPSVSAPGPKSAQKKPGADTLGPSVSAPGFFGGGLRTWIYSSLRSCARWAGLGRSGETDWGAGMALNPPYGSRSPRDCALTASIFAYPRPRCK
jgi:hypothetical protein